MQSEFSPAPQVAEDNQGVPDYEFGLLAQTISNVPLRILNSHRGYPSGH